MRTCLTYQTACKVELQPFKRSYSQLTFFNLKNIFTADVLKYVYELILECLRKYVLKIYFKNCPEGNICGTFLKKGQKCTLSKVGFDLKLRYILSLCLFWPRTHRAFVRGRTPLQRPIVPKTNRTGQPGQAPLFVQQQRKQ